MHLTNGTADISDATGAVLYKDCTFDGGFTVNEDGRTGIVVNVVNCVAASANLQGASTINLTNTTVTGNLAIGDNGGEAAPTLTMKDCVVGAFTDGAAAAPYAVTFNGAHSGPIDTAIINPTIRTPFYTTVTAANANTTAIVPAGYRIVAITFKETANHAVTGGVKIGTTSGGTDVVTAQAVTANASGFVADASLLKTMFSMTTAQTLFIQPVSAWNSANVIFTLTLQKVQ